MYCHNCGEEIGDNDIFCGSCGTKTQRPEGGSSIARRPDNQGKPEVERCDSIKNVTGEKVSDVEGVMKNDFKGKVDTPTQGDRIQETAVCEEGDSYKDKPHIAGNANIDIIESNPNGIAEDVRIGKAKSRGVDKVNAPTWKNSKTYRLVVIESIVLTVAIFVFMYVGKNAYNYANVGKEYVDAINTGNYGRAYDLMDLNGVSESDFINKEAYILVNQQKEVLDNYQSEVVSSSKDSDSALVTVIVNNQDNYTVSLVKGAGKEFLVFDSWKVPYSSICSNYEINVCEGSVVELDGVKLDESYLVHSGNSDGEWDSYNIPYLFIGNHNVKVSFGDFEGDNEALFVSGDNQTYYHDVLELSEESQGELVIRCADDFKILMEALVTGKPFTEIAEKLTSSQYNEKNVYDSLQYKYLSDGASNGVISVDYSDIKGTLYDSWIQESGPIVEVKLQMQYKYNYINNSVEKTSSGGDSVFFTYCYDEDAKNWNICDFDWPEPFDTSGYYY